MRINPDLKKLGARTVVPVNFSVSSQGNDVTWVILATTSTRRRYYMYLLYEEERKMFARNIFSVRRICHHSDFFIS